MTFIDRYKRSKSWQEKATIMEIFHLAMNARNHNSWSIQKTASYFNCSLGLVSENLKLAHALHSDDRLHLCESRQHALLKLK